MLTRTQITGFANKVIKSSAGLWLPGFDAVVDRRHNILAVLKQNAALPFLIPAHNIVTDAGDIYYAQRGASEVPTNPFGVLELASAGTPAKGADRSAFTMIASTEKAHDATYPKADDDDTDNSGRAPDVCTYRTSYGKADFNAASITHGIITNVTPGANEPILTGFAFSAGFAKTADDTLKVFTNHNMNGV